MVLFAGILLSWIVLAVWWSTVPIVSLLVPGLVVVGGFAVMILCGSIWAARRAEFDSGLASPAFDRSLNLALIGHAFLFFVVLQKPLAIPPWPFLGVLAVLDLAIGVAALYSHSGELHLGALASSQIILIVWQFTVQEAPWPSIAIFCALGAATLGFIWFILAQKLNLTGATPGGIFFGVAAIAGGQLGIAVVVAATIVSGVPGVALLAAATVIFSSLTLAVDWLTDFHFLAPVSVLSSAFALWMWSNAHFKSENWMEEFLFAASIYSIFLAYPVLMGSRARTLLQPYLAAVIASATFFLFARHSLLAGGFAYAIGLLPVTQAALMAGLLWRLLRLETPGDRSLARLALVAGAVLAFVTVAIPLQFEKQWITIGWALQAAALAWLWRKIPHDGIVMWTGGLLIAVFSRLMFNPDVFSYYPRSTIPILNWYLYTYLISAAAFLAVGWLLRHQSESIWNGLPRLSAIAAAGGAVLLFALLNIEIADYYSKGADLTFNFSADLGQDLTYTIGWGVFAFGLLIAGIVLRTKAARVSAIALLSVTVAKCFLHDLWRLGGLYRIGSFVGLAVCLTMVTLLLQRFVLRPQGEVK